MNIAKYISTRDPVLTEEEAGKVRANLPTEEEVNSFVLALDLSSQWDEYAREHTHKFFEAWLDSMTKEIA